MAVTASAAASVLVYRPDSGFEGDADPEAIEVDVEPIDEIGRFPATLKIELEETDEVLSAGAEGLITSVAIGAGEVLRHGVEFYRVDGKPVVAYSGSIPFHRALTPGDSGMDVTVLRGLLVETGHLDRENSTESRNEQGEDEIDNPLAEAIREFNRELGLVDFDSTPARLQTLFDPKYTAWIGEASSISLGTIDLTPGQPNPTQGDVLATGVLSVGEASITTTAEIVEGLGRLHFTANGIEVSVAADTLLVEPSSLPITEIPTDSDLDTTEIDGVLVWLSPDDEDVYLVPGTALLVGAEDGAVCVLVNGSGRQLEPVEVEIVRATLQGTIVRLTTSASTARVLMNPRQLGYGQC